MNTNETIELTDLEPQGEVKGGIHKAGLGHLILPTTNTYSGTTTVNSGAALHLKSLEAGQA